MDSTNNDGWITLAELRNGAVFETRGGVRAVKSEYHYPYGGIECVLLASGEAAHFSKTGDRREHNGTEVREIDVAAERARADDADRQAAGLLAEHAAFLALLSAMGLRTGATDLCGALKGALALAEDRARAAEREACAEDVGGIDRRSILARGRGVSDAVDATLDAALDAIRARRGR